jgi:DNA-binding transcriptional MerR regulator
MEVNFLKLLEELGLTQEELSQSLRDQIKAFNKLKKAYEDALAELEEYVEEDRDELQTSLNETLAMLEDRDDELVKKLRNWFKNKDIYAKNAENLKQSRDAKAAANSGVPPTTQAPPPTTEAPIVPPTTEAPKANDGNNDKDGKGSSIFWWVLVGAVAIGTVGAVILKKK